MTEEQSQLKALLSKPQKIVIIIHRNPDGDAVGSGTALKVFLMQMGHEVSLISPNEIPEYLKWMPFTKDILLFDENKEQTEKILNSVELIFTLDFNDLSRTGREMEKMLHELEEKTYIMIDHHLEPSNYAKYMFSDHHKSSTSEMVYEFITTLSDKSAITKSMATCLYTGIMTDTGSFKFPNTTANTMRIAADLMAKGIKHNKIQIKIYDSFTTDKLHLLGEALNKLIFLPEYKTAYIALSKANLDKHNYQKGDTDNLANQALSIKGMKAAIVFTERDGIMKISFRSKGEENPVNVLAGEHFDGGGHANASGGMSELTVAETLDKIKGLVPQYFSAL